MPPKRPLKDSIETSLQISTVQPQKSSRESKKCNECRRRHVKCDEQRPKCSNCTKTNAECSYSHKGIRYDHISDRQKRDDMYTEIEDISNRVDTLLKKLENEPTSDDVAKLARSYGWDVKIAPNGQKRIVTNISTTSQLAALIPKALGEVYIPNSSSAQQQQPPPSTITLKPSFSNKNSTIVQNQVKPRKTKRITLERYVAAYTNPSIHVLNTAIATCPSLFTTIMSPRLLSQFAGHPQLSMLHTSACCTLSLNSCIHNPNGLFLSSTLSSFDPPTHDITNGPTMMDFNSMSSLGNNTHHHSHSHPHHLQQNISNNSINNHNHNNSNNINNNNNPFYQHQLSHYLGIAAEDTTLIPPQPRFAECNLANVYWNLLRTSKLLDDGQFSQAYVNLGVMITKAFSLQLHRQSGYEQFKTPLEREAAKRIFWAIWLYDSQMPLLQESCPSIKLEDIDIEKPCSIHDLQYQQQQQDEENDEDASLPSPLSMTLIEEDEEDKCHTEFLRYLIEVRWIRVELENTLNAFTGWNDDRAVLSLITHQMRKLRRYYEFLDDQFKIESYLHDIQHKNFKNSWSIRTRSVLLLEHAMNWLVLFDRFLPLKNEEKPITPFPANLAIHFCRQAADVMTLIFEQWFSVQNDCQYRWFFSHFVNCLDIHKYISTYSSEQTVHKWKAYASLKFMWESLQKMLLVVDLPMGRRVYNDLCQLVVILKKNAASCWNPTEENDLIESYYKYFSKWKPSDDILDTKDNGSIFAKESSTMFIILQMQKKGKQPSSSTTTTATNTTNLMTSGTKNITVTV